MLLKKFPAGKDLLVALNFESCLSRYSGYNTQHLALLSGMVKLREIANTYNQQTPILLIEAWLFQLTKFMGWEVEDCQIRQTALFLYEDNSFWNLPELTLFFKKLSKGQYGMFYGKFDGLKICSAAREYRFQRGMIISKMTEEEQKQLIG